MVEQNGLEEIVERKSKFGLYAKVLLIPGYSFKAEYDGNKKRGYSTMDSFFMTGELAGFELFKTIAYGAVAYAIYDRLVN